MARNAALQLQEAVEKILLGLAELGYVHQRLSAAQDRAHRNLQDFHKIMTPGIAGPWVLELLRACRKRFHPTLCTVNRLPNAIPLSGKAFALDAPRP